MALQLKVIRTAISGTGDEMYLQDSTGMYDAVDNEGGWGTPNPERNSRALLMQAINHTSEADVELTVKDYDPETVTDFTLETPKDGYIEAIMVSVPKALPAAEGSYGWTVTEGLVQMKDGVITPVKPLDVYNDALYTEAVSFKTVLLANIALYRNTKNLELIKLRMRKFDDLAHNRELQDLEDHFSFVRSLLEGARYSWCIDSYTEAQRIVEAFNEIAYE